MNKFKFTKIIDSEHTKLALVIVSALILIMISIVLFEDIALDNTILIYNIYGTLSLIGFLYSYSLTKKNMRNDLCLGITRQDIFKSYIINIIKSLIISILLVLYYMVVYKLVVNVNKSIFVLFDVEEVLFLPLTFLTLSFLGFFLGLVQMKKRFFYTLFLIINTVIVIFVIYYTMAYLLDLILLGFALLLGSTNYFLMKKYDI